MDRWNPAGRLEALLAVVIVGAIAAVFAWLLLPGDTRRMMIRTVRERLAR
jgi:hypothetical protein